MHKRLWQIGRQFLWQGLVKKQSVGNRLGLVVFMYVLLLPVPVTLLLLSRDEFSYVGVFVLVTLLAISAYSLATWFNRTVVKKV
jgi:hypothetical protein